MKLSNETCLSMGTGSALYCRYLLNSNYNQIAKNTLFADILLGAHPPVASATHILLSLQLQPSTGHGQDFFLYYHQLHWHSSLVFNNGITIDIQHWHSTLTFNTDIRHWLSTLTFDIDIHHWHSTLTFDIDIHHWHSTLTFGIGIRQGGPAAEASAFKLI